MNALYLTLLIYDLSILGNGLNLSNYFTNIFNDFIRENYQKNKELFSIIFDIELLEEYINAGQTEIISRKNLKKLTSKYNSVDNYLELLVYLETPHIKILQ